MPSKSLNHRLRAKLLLTALGWAVALLVFFPIFWMILTSFKTEKEAIAGIQHLIFRPTLQNYHDVQQRANYAHFAWNSILLACGSTLAALLIGLPAAYAMAFRPMRHTKDMLVWMLSTRMMPAAGVLAPIYLLFRDGNLLDTRSGLLAVDTLMNLPIVIWMLYAFFRDVPAEILEAGRMDGAGYLREIFSLLLPLSLPSIFSTSLLVIVLAWNEAFWSLILTAAKAAPLTVYIASFSSPEGLFWAKLSAASTMAILPILVLGWISQRQLVRGLTFGAVSCSSMSTVRLEGVTKSFAETVILQGVDLTVNDKEFIVIVGPSGCGKTTLLRLIAGLETITAGDLWIDGVHVNDVAPARRGLALVFQSYALYPHMTVEENMAFSLKLAGVPKAERRKKVEEAARILHLEAFLDRKPKELSGGQRQRVAIGRAIVRHPKVFLFDEPLSNLDAELRVRTRLELMKLHKQLEATIIYVTHDQTEAMTMADRIVVMQGGAIEQIGSPLEVYLHPVNRFVGGLYRIAEDEFPPCIRNGGAARRCDDPPQQRLQLCVSFSCRTV